jgi:hypothetical protein
LFGGSNDAVSENVVNTGNVEGLRSNATSNPSRIGGISGYSNRLILKNAANYGNINGDQDSYQLAGLIGTSDSGSILNSFNKGNITGSSNSFDLGGLLGYGNQVSISNTFNSGTIQGLRNLGGLVGQANSSMFIYYSINFGQVISNSPSTISTIGSIVGSTVPQTQDFEQVYYTNTNLVNEEAVDGIAFGTKLTNLSLINEEFFTAMMEWSTDTWSFEGLDIENGVYPVLVFTLPPEEVIA